MTNDKIGRATVERAFRQLPDDADFKLTRGMHSLRFLAIGYSQSVGMSSGDHF